MDKHISLDGYLARFDQKSINEEPDIYLSQSDCLKICKRAKRDNVINIPLLITHDDNTKIGYCKDILVDTVGLFCSCIIDDVNFMTAIIQLAKDYISRSSFKQYWTVNSQKNNICKYLFSLFSAFSLSHNKKSFKINHIALVGVGRRRGTLIDYKLGEAKNSKKNNINVQRILNILKLLVNYQHSNRNLSSQLKQECLLEDAKICDRSADFIYADLSKTYSEKNMNSNNPTGESSNNFYTTLFEAAYKLGSQHGKRRMGYDDTHDNRKRYFDRVADNDDEDEDMGEQPFFDKRKRQKMYNKRPLRQDILNHEYNYSQPIQQRQNQPVYTERQLPLQDQHSGGDFYEKLIENKFNASQASLIETIKSTTKDILKKQIEEGFRNQSQLNQVSDTVNKDSIAAMAATAAITAVTNDEQVEADLNKKNDTIGLQILNDLISKDKITKS